MLNEQAQQSAELAQRLLDAGIPVIVCRPNPHYRPDDPTQPELFPPAGWNIITIAEARAKFPSYRPGVDTLAMVAGHGIDVLDVDTKVSGVSLADVPNDIERGWGVTVTPSGGFHLPVRSTGFSSGSLYFGGKYVGDYCGGTADGGGRKLVYLPGSNRPKYEGKIYALARDWDIDKIIDTPPDDALVAYLEVCPGLSKTGIPGSPAADRYAVDKFLAENSVVSDCSYGKAAIYGDPLMGTAGAFDQVPDFGNPDNGLHAWITRTTNRAVELCRDGCLDASVFDDIDRKAQQLAVHHYDRNRYRSHEMKDCLAWAVTNVGGGGGCKQHSVAAHSAKFWERREWLADIYRLAKHNIVSPWALLATFLARYATEVDPSFQLPHGGSLNLYVALLGKPGMGKSTAIRSVEAANPLWSAPQWDLGSGEGMIELFGSYDFASKAWQQENRSIYFVAEEVSTLAAVTARTGSTLIGLLNSGFMGASLSAGYKGANKFKVPAHSYRLCIVTGVQPELADKVLSQDASGFAQRFLWADLTYHWKELPNGPIPSLKLPATGARQQITVADSIQQEILEERVARAAGDVEGNEHRSFIKLKVAALFALMDGITAVTQEHFDLAETVMTFSDSTIEKAKKHLADVQHRKAESRGRMQARTAEASDAYTVERVADKIARHMQSQHQDGSHCSHKHFKQYGGNKKDRPLISDAFGVLADRGVVVAEKRDSFSVYRLALESH